MLYTASECFDWYKCSGNNYELSELREGLMKKYYQYCRCKCSLEKQFQGYPAGTDEDWISGNEKIRKKGWTLSKMSSLWYIINLVWIIYYIKMNKSNKWFESVL